RRKPANPSPGRRFGYLEEPPTQRLRLGVDLFVAPAEQLDLGEQDAELADRADERVRGQVDAHPGDLPGGLDVEQVAHPSLGEGDQVELAAGEARGRGRDERRAAPRHLDEGGEERDAEAALVERREARR